MPDTKQEVVTALRELAELTMLDEADPQSFRVRAYEMAERAIAGETRDIAQLSLKELQKIEGIGKSTAEKIRQLVDTGKMEKLELLRAKYPPSILRLLRIQGLGPKAVQKLRKELGVESVEDLRRVLKEHKVRALKGFGEKSEEKLTEALRRLDAEGVMERTPIAVALPLAERMVAELREVAGVSDVVYCGSLRRFLETVGDLDITVASTDAARVMETVASMPVVDHVLGRGDTKISFVTRRGTQVDVRVVEKAQLGAAMLYFTGSKTHNIKLRQRALARGWTLNEYALSELEGGKIIARESEAEIYAALGLPFIPPVLREDTGEIEAAERGELPRALPRIAGDFHVHTSLSGDARSSLQEMAQAARTRGYRVMAITDHAEGTVSGVSREKLLAQRDEIAEWNARHGDTLRLLHGVELNIGANGELDYDAEFRRGFDFCIASVHDHFELDRAAQTKRIVAAMEDPTVRMIGHLSARMIGGRPGIELDLDAVLAAAERTRTALEINGGLPRLDMSVAMLRHAKERAVTFVVTSDAHHVNELDQVHNAARNAERAWVDETRVANAWLPERLLAWATAAKS